jgi:hypothetical protein
VRPANFPEFSFHTTRHQSHYTGADFKSDRLLAHLPQFNQPFC